MLLRILLLSSLALCAANCAAPPIAPETIELNWNLNVNKVDYYGSDLRDGLLVGSYERESRVQVFDVANRTLSFARDGFTAYGGVAAWNDLLLLQRQGNPGVADIYTKTGQLLRYLKMDSKNPFTLNRGMVQDKNAVYLTTSHSLFAYDMETLAQPNSQPLWQRYFESPEASGIDDLAVDSTNGIIYIATEKPTNKLTTTLYALNRQGQELWQKDLGTSPEGLTYARRAKLQAYEKGVVASLYGSGVVELYNPKGEAVWANPVRFVCDETNVLSKPAIVDEVLYGSPAGDHCLFAIDLKTGRKLWDFKAPQSGTFDNKPVVVNGVVYASNGRVYAVDAKDGQLLAASEVYDRSLQFERGNIHYDPPRNQLIMWGEKIYSFKPIR